MEITHIHADHVSGKQELKSRTGAEICYMEGSPVSAWMNSGGEVV
ncbi:hypothetical protein [Desulfotignum balticum]|jgi:glyoxylase-like metal-dependent hydrolase (beta-lactamase superfamily II)|nr:hypothetical protein [Desulfotignum balticum]